MRVFERVYHRDGYRCVYCGRFMLSDFDSWQSIHTDHLVPLSKGGSDKEENLVTSCTVCNVLKGAFVPKMKFSEAERDTYIQAIRGHILNRRSELFPWFFQLLEQMNTRFLPVKEE